MIAPSPAPGGHRHDHSNGLAARVRLRVVSLAFQRTASPPFRPAVFWFLAGRS